MKIDQGFLLSAHINVMSGPKTFCFWKNWRTVATIFCRSVSQFVGPRQRAKHQLGAGRVEHSVCEERLKCWQSLATGAHC